MNHINHIKGVLTAATLVLALTACDSKQEDHREKVLENKADMIEKKADTVRDTGEVKADHIENRDPGLNSSGTEHAAEVTRDTSEARADRLDEKADRIREQK
ncbi:MAG: hypothetical protein ABIR84_00680 [Candidatus Nitrotoga sp.]